MATYEICTPEELEKIEAARRSLAAHSERVKLRDQFAAAALTGLLSEDGDRYDPHMGELCARAFEWADAMIAAREVK